MPLLFTSAPHLDIAMYITALKHICRLRGGSQAQLMTADDGQEYVVKFQGNPQTTRILANEYLAGHLARMIGLSVPEPLIIQVGAETIDECKIEFQLAETRVAPTAGLQFASRLIVNEEVHDWLPIPCIGNIKNRKEFVGILAFDKWIGNADGRQVVFHKRRAQRKYRASFIDFGYCFNAGEWSFPDSPLRGAYARQEVYACIQSLNDFEPWLSRIERCSKTTLQSIARDIPVEWYGEHHDLDCLLDSLSERRNVVRHLINDFRKSSRNPFPNWKPNLVADARITWAPSRRRFLHRDNSRDCPTVGTRKLQEQRKPEEQNTEAVNNARTKTPAIPNSKSRSLLTRDQLSNTK